MKYIVDYGDDDGSGEMGGEGYSGKFHKRF